MSEKLSLVVKEIKFPKMPIAERLHKALLDFQREYHIVPKGLILGPNEWLEFELMARENFCFRFSQADEPSFHGVPLHLSERPGVQMMLPGRMAARFARGLMKKEADQ